jgi:hypothetical protein
MVNNKEQFAGLNVMVASKSKSHLLKTECDLQRAEGCSSFKNIDSVRGLICKNCMLLQILKFLMIRRCCTANGNMTDHIPDASKKELDQNLM